MNRFQPISITDPDGVQATLVPTSLAPEHSGEALIKLSDGTEFFVPSEFLVLAEDGSYRFTLSIAAIRNQQRGEATKVIPVLEERLSVEKRAVETGRLLVQKKVESTDTVVDEALFEETCDVERVPINRILTAPLQSRYEGETLILPVMEEVLVVEKRLILREEVRITRRRREIRNPQTHTVLRERIEVERVG